MLWTAEIVCRSHSHSVMMPPIQQSYRSGFPRTTSWIMASNSHAAKSNCQFCVQVHAWVTSMSLKEKRLQPWQTLTQHPLATVPFRRSKRTQANISNLQNRKLSSRPGASKPAVLQSFNKAAAGRSNQKQQSLTVALHANASSLLPHTTSALQNGLYPEVVTQQAASEFKIGHILSVLAVGTSGPVFHARYNHHTSAVAQRVKILLTPVLVEPLACICPLQLNKSNIKPSKDNAQSMRMHG